MTGHDHHRIDGGPEPTGVDHDRLYPDCSMTPDQGPTVSCGSCGWSVTLPLIEPGRVSIEVVADWTIAGSSVLCERCSTGWRPLVKYDPDAIKVAVCEYLLRVNEERDGMFIPPTAINWLGDGLVSAVIKP